MELLDTHVENPKLLIAKIEYQLVANFRPTFMHVTSPDEDGDIQVLLSTNSFRYKTIAERIHEVFAVFNANIPEVLNGRLVLVQALDGKQIECFLENLFYEDKEL